MKQIWKDNYDEQYQLRLKIAKNRKGKSLEEQYGKEKADSMKQKARETMLKLRENPEFIKKARLSININPNHKEKKILDFINSNGLNFKFVGNGYTFI